MPGRKIYSAELNLEIVERYLKGDIGIKKLAQEYHVGYGDIQKWRDAYQEHGVEELSTAHGTYTGEFKVSVVGYIDYYNNKRIKAKLKGLSPVQYRLQSLSVT